MLRQETLTPWEQLPMYAVSDELAPRLERFELERNLEELRDNGYTIIQVGRELTDRIRSAILRLVEGATAALGATIITSGFASESLARYLEQLDSLAAVHAGL